MLETSSFSHHSQVEKLYAADRVSFLTNPSLSFKLGTFFISNYIICSSSPHPRAFSSTARRNHKIKILQFHCVRTTYQPALQAELRVRRCGANPYVSRFLSPAHSPLCSGYPGSPKRLPGVNVAFKTISKSSYDITIRSERA
jgi:hypothetical protein